VGDRSDLGINGNGTGLWEKTGPAVPAQVVPGGLRGGVGILSHFAARDAAQAATAECNFALAVPGTIMNKCIAAMHRRVAMKLAAVTLKRPMAQFRRF